MTSLAQRPVGLGTTIDLQGLLAQAHGFSLSELASNRAGRLAPEQAARLRRRARRRIVLSLATMAAALLIASIVGVGAGGSALLSLLLFGTIVALAGAQLIVTCINTLHDTRSESVAVIEGEVAKTNSVDADEVGNSATTYYYKIGRQKFEVSPAAYAALPSGLTCRLYYSPRGKQLLSVEPVAEPEPSVLIRQTA